VGLENPVHLIFIAAVALIVLGPKRLPALARALGQAVREFRASLDEGSRPQPEDEVAPAAPAAGDAATPGAARAAEPVAGSVQAPDQGASDEPR
jgi:sec-independent protein translocase protein TatA